MSVHEQVNESLGAYLLGALPADEAASVEEHVADCERCRDDMAELRVATAALPSAVPPVDPPGELKDRVMAVVRSEAELLRAAGEEADRPPAPAPAPERARRAWWRGWTLRPAVAVAAATLLLVAGGVLGFALGLGEDGDGTRTVEAAAAPAGASVQLVVDDEGNTLRVRDMPQAPGDRVWQVWVKRPGAAAPEPTDALFTVDRDGTATVAVPGDLSGAERVMVTSERRGGSDVPTSAPVVDVRLS